MKKGNHFAVEKYYRVKKVDGEYTLATEFRAVGLSAFYADKRYVISDKHKSYQDALDSIFDKVNYDFHCDIEIEGGLI